MTDAAILTGDLIASTGAEPAKLQATMARLAEASADIGRWQGTGARFTRFRGDGWQMRIDPGLALRAVTYIHACLRAAEGLLGTRIAIGLGPVDSLGSADLSDARGEAFAASGRALDTLRLRQFAIAGPGTDARDKIILQLIEDIILRWTRPQAAAAALALNLPAMTLEESGARLGISPQAVSYRLSAGGVQSLRDAIRDWEHLRGEP